MNAWLALVIGSVAGGVSRYVVASAVGHTYQSPFPYGTLVVNFFGCVIVGFLSVAAGVRFPFPEEARLLLVTGFCGGFTTFSALILETVSLVRGGAWAMAGAYLSSTVVLGFVAFFLGSVVGRSL